eukprot:CAMPEP_0119113886 /NCGR_PEP_ID=MMETSP1180-20130426/45492_1 /TAXON_ID=3052 ORGANISM="Chlamydomonas cf sp, Strain CCMP681" /NCGR_SAMPLE_ID=MMETSP1180 /ASSEMBLY_ACC=CAM_ASM_000741 /LENGTH=87 /DNA_ID=CAMNT_0007102167 /DNA_START=362 /DNA_END=626 /DNA_ORIENTATION=-
MCCANTRQVAASTCATGAAWEAIEPDLPVPSNTSAAGSTTWAAAAGGARNDHKCMSAATSRWARELSTAVARNVKELNSSGCAPTSL